MPYEKTITSLFHSKATPTYNSDDTLNTRYTYTNQRTPYKMTKNNQTYYLSYNHLGSLRLVTKDDGTVVKEIEYSAFGEIVNDTNQSLHVHIRFAGGLYDQDTRLTRFGYRDYDAEIGRWTAKDPIGFGGGDSNLYGYVLGDPVNFVDPEGLWAPQVIGALIGGGFSLYFQVSQNGWSNVNWGAVGMAGLTGAWGGFAGLGFKGILGGASRGALGGAANNAYGQFSNSSCQEFSFSGLGQTAFLGGFIGAFGSGTQNYFSTIQKPGGYGNIVNTAFPINPYFSTGNYGNYGAAIGGSIGNAAGGYVGN